MQGLRKTKLISLFVIPLIAACTSPRPTGISDSTEQYPLTQPTTIDNCSIGCPSGGGALTLYRQAYTLNNNGSTKFANWVAYKITKQTSASGRPRNWKADPDVPAEETLTPADYSGANVALKMDRGHQANLASMGGVSDWQTLNYLTNITPQKSDLNQGAWARLEDQERSLSKATEIDAVYVTTGPLYEKNMGLLPGTNKIHTIPSGYWKVIFTGSNPANGLYAAFIMEQDTPRSANFCDFQVTVNEIERRSGLTLWSGLPQELQPKLKSEKGRLSQKIGCSAMGEVSSR
ncbi:DNA/RNA non-specific endonuclease [Pseudomonas corrugata]|uniref:DNA/RNA non-specific endonuclease n=1 Tax=Pseudomonas corrugata TaxID=47879 RepID=UPI0015863DF4|nr:DNA/RNA non-specific endonuclease [Pseudomonas corrugata]MCI0997078.1 DNA/RNA non-specific endonuclease [Pseudomonas corrugata]NUT69281.1 DNA/RNA non-specific endonuclease [Pseudomonas corrugata]